MMSVRGLRTLESLRAQTEANLRDELPDWKLNYVLADLRNVYEARDLDLMRVYNRFLPNRNSASLRNAAEALRRVYGPSVSGIITDEHLDVFSDIWKALAALYTKQGRQADILTEDVSAYAFEDLSNTALILHVIEDREIGSASEMRECIKMMRESVQTPALMQGVL